MSKHLRRALIVAVIVVAALWLASNYRLRIEAWFWHRRHGDVASFGHYMVPVPSNWYMQDFGSNGDALLVRIDTDDRSADRARKPHATVTLLLVGPGGNLENWAALNMASLPKMGKSPVTQKMLDLPDGEKMACVGGDELSAPGVYAVGPTIWRCKLPDEVEILVSATQPDVKQIWDILLNIRRVS